MITELWSSIPTMVNDNNNREKICFDKAYERTIRASIRLTQGKREKKSLKKHAGYNNNMDRKQKRCE